MAQFEEYNNPWSAENSEWYNEGKNNWFENEFVQTQNIAQQASFNTLADAAEYLGKQDLVMESYWQFQNSVYDWFFSPNPYLKSATKRPSSFKSWDDWSKFGSKVKKTIGNLAGFNKNVTDVKKTDSDLKKLKKAYKKWNSNLYSIHWASNYGGSWMCNVFVGDAIFLYKKSITNSEKHYYDPEQISKGRSPLKEVKSKDVKRGTIAVLLNGHHIEIITSLKKYWISDDGFCSIGAGRGTRNETGSIKCDSGSTSSETREIENPNNKYFEI